MACHIRIASDAAKFGQPEVKLGLVPGYGGTGRLARLVGRGRALELLLTGDMIDAQEAHRIGLVNRVVPVEELLATTESMMARILGNGPLAVASCIELLVGNSQRSADMEQRAREAGAFGQLAETLDAAEGVSAFIEKRRPRFDGR
jgi:enoyl-CoA hydratase